MLQARPGARPLGFRRSSEEGGGRAGPRPSWVNNVLGALAEEAGAAAGPAGKGTPSLRGEDSAAAADGRRLASPASPASA